MSQEREREEQQPKQTQIQKLEKAIERLTGRRPLTEEERLDLVRNQEL